MNGGDAEDGHIPQSGVRSIVALKSVSAGSGE